MVSTNENLYKSYVPTCRFYLFVIFDIRSFEFTINLIHQLFTDLKETNEIKKEHYDLTKKSKPELTEKQTVFILLIILSFYDFHSSCCFSNV